MKGRAGLFSEVLNKLGGGSEANGRSEPEIGFRFISQTPADPNMTDLLQGNTPNF